MNNNIKNEWPKLLFIDGLDEAAVDEALDKGCASYVLVELEDGRKYEVEFQDADSMPRSMENVVKNTGLHCITQPGLILLTDVTIENMYEAVRELAKEGKFGFFAHLKEWNPNEFAFSEYRYLPITENSAYVKSELKRRGWEVRQLKKRNQAAM